MDTRYPGAPLTRVVSVLFKHETNSKINKSPAYLPKNTFLKFFIQFYQER